MLVKKIFIPKTIKILILKKDINLIIFFNIINKKIMFLKIDRNIEINIKNNFIYLQNNNNVKDNKNKLNTTFKHILNIIEGLNFFYKEKLFFKGSGFKINLSKNKRFLLFLIGYSHLVFYRIPYNIYIKSIDFKMNYIEIFSCDKILLYNFLYKIKKLKKFDVYKGKGLFLYKDNIVLKKSKNLEKK